MVETFTVHITPYDLDRNTFIYLPDNWQTSGRRYPVIYMFDGHNLFFDSTATFGTCWGLKDYLDAHPNAIVVAPECNHEGNKRLEEYCPYAVSYTHLDVYKRQPFSLRGVRSQSSRQIWRGSSVPSARRTLYLMTALSGTSAPCT